MKTKIETVVMTQPIGYQETKDIKPPPGNSWYVSSSSIGTTIIMDNNWIPRPVIVLCIIWSRTITVEEYDA